MTADLDLLDDLLTIAAQAEVIVDVAPDAVAAARWFVEAPMVLVGIDAAAECARASLPSRPGIVLVGHHEQPGPPDWDVAHDLRAEHLATLPAAEPWLVQRIGRIARAAEARMVAVLGGRGGAGASVLAAGLAVTAARAGMRTLLVDADPLGGGVDLVLGWESLDGLRWPALTQTSGRVSPPALVEVLPQRGELVVLSWDRGDVLAVPAEAMASALDAGRRGQDLVVIDLPRRLDDASVLALEAADRGYLVVPAELRACAAAARVAAAAAPHCPSLSIVVRGPAPGGLRGPDVAKALGLPLAGVLRPEPGLARGLERGQPPARDGRSPLARLCQRLLTELGLGMTKAVA
ncbi:septum site-determining protein Ssd [Rugosimonospora acidiphila]|uniref:septum site-determining protein Ssd n=1 Tax=Rugosimonospora acidiphila TaxID=556531 RepID=UPI0031F017A1